MMLTRNRAAVLRAIAARDRTLATIVGCADDGSTLVAVSEERRCACGRLTMLLVNRGGRTRCLWCADDAGEAIP